MRFAPDRIVRRSLSAVLLPVAFIACSSGGEKARDSSTGAVADTTFAAKCVGDNAGLTLPAGICATAFADSIAHARHIVVASNGDVYVTLEGTQPNQKTPPPAKSISSNSRFPGRSARMTVKKNTLPLNLARR